MYSIASSRLQTRYEIFVSLSDDFFFRDSVIRGVTVYVIKRRRVTYSHTHRLTAVSHTNVCQNQFRVSAPPLNFYQRRGSSREFGPRLFEVQIKAYALLLALITAAHSSRPRSPPPRIRPLAAALSHRGRRRVKLRCVVVSLQL